MTKRYLHNLRGKWVFMEVSWIYSDTKIHLVAFAIPVPISYINSSTNKEKQHYKNAINVKNARAISEFTSISFLNPKIS